MLGAYEISKRIDGDTDPFKLPTGTSRHISEVKIGNAVLGYRAVRRRLRGSKWNHALGRMYDIERLIRARHGNFVPRTDDAEIYAEAIAAVFFVEFSEVEYVQMTMGWCLRWYPWASRHYIEEIIYERARIDFRPIAQDALGHMLNLKDAERTRLGIRTIGACDVTAAQRKRRQKKKKREADRLSKCASRRANGVRPRAEYLATALTRTRPWEYFGCSRRTWEKRGKPRPGEDAALTPVAMTTKPATKMIVC